MTGIATVTAPRIALTIGEPAGIGPEICLAVAASPWDARIVAVGDRATLEARLPLFPGVRLVEAGDDRVHRPGVLPVMDVPAPATVTPGRPDPANAAAVLAMLRHAGTGCRDGRYDAVVTAPVHKAVINDAGQAFSGHTEYLAAIAGITQPVMMLAAGRLRVALATTHLPLREVPDAIDRAGIERTLRILDQDLRHRFGLAAPRILVCGLNPHAGEGGHLGKEDDAIIAPAIRAIRGAGINAEGPVPADTAFTPTRLETADAVLAMYHDQGLPVLKHAGFGEAVNVTLGLPFVRTSVDHGTALDLAGSGHADAGSLAAALRLAIDLASPGMPA